jgi:hypothetical protein
MDQVNKAAQAYCDAHTIALRKGLEEAEQREQAERKDKEELKSLNKQLIGEIHELKRQLKDAKDEHQEWRLQYSAALSEKIALLRPYEVSHTR